MMLFERLYKWLGKYVNCPLSLCNVKHFPFAYFLHISTIKIRPYTQPGLSEKIHDAKFMMIITMIMMITILVMTMIMTMEILIIF